MQKLADLLGGKLWLHEEKTELGQDFAEEGGCVKIVIEPAPQADAELDQMREGTRRKQSRESNLAEPQIGWCM